jgi:hypothetical protein
MSLVWMAKPDSAPLSYSSAAEQLFHTEKAGISEFPRTTTEQNAR